MRRLRNLLSLLVVAAAGASGCNDFDDPTEARDLTIEKVERANRADVTPSIERVTPTPLKDENDTITVRNRPRASRRGFSDIYIRRASSTALRRRDDHLSNGVACSRSPAGDGQVVIRR